MKRYFVFVALFIGFCTSCFSQTGFVNLNCDGFSLDGQLYYPHGTNYLVDFTYNCVDNYYYLSPHWNHSSFWGFPNTCPSSGRFIYDADDDQAVALQKIRNDFDRISSIGFNFIRVFAFPAVDNGELVLPGANYSTYFSLIDQLLTEAGNAGLKVVLTVASGQAYQAHEATKAHLELVADHFKNREEILAYDLGNEPDYPYTQQDKDDKLRTGSWIAEYYYTVKRIDENHLITVNIIRPESSFNWDAMMTPVDFVSYHHYGHDESLPLSMDLVNTFIYWCAHSIEKPWIIGETGFSGTDLIIADPDAKVGSEADQDEFAKYSLQRNLDCGCQGYTWWQFQEVNWFPAWEQHLGLVNRYDFIGNGFADETDKRVVATMGTLPSLVRDDNKCVRQDNH